MQRHLGTLRTVLLAALVLTLSLERITFSQFILGEPVSLGDPIESPLNELAPDLSADGLTLFFQRGNYNDYADLFWATRESLDSPWNDPQPIVSLNTDRHEGSPAISPDGLELYFDDGHRSGYPSLPQPGGMGGPDIWVSRWDAVNGEWGTPMNLGAPVNSTSRDYCPNLSADGFEMYFSSNRPGGFGQTDLWVTRRPTLDQAWGDPVNLGPVINRGSHDERPAISPGGRTLIFGSTRPGGRGGPSSMWVSVRESIEDDWGAPVVLSNQVNGPYWSFDPEFSPDGNTLYYGRFDSGPGNTLWQVPILSGADPKDGPERAWSPTPGNKTMDLPKHGVLLSWEAGRLAESHDLFLGLSWDDVNAATADSATYLGRHLEPTYALNDLAFGQTYYWRVDEVNGPPDFTTHKGDVWRFTVEPFAYPITHVTAGASGSFDDAVLPERTIDGSGLSNGLHGSNQSDMWISDQVPAWIQYEFDRPYILHEMVVWNSNQLIESFVGFGAKDVVIEYSLDGIDWTRLEGVTQFAQAPGTAGYATNNVVDFEGALANTVRITINTVYGMATQTGLSEVQFTYIPVYAREPQPADSVTTDGLDVTLTWRPGRLATTHDLLFSEDMLAVEEGSALIATTTESTFDLADQDLKYGRIYHWRINEVNESEDPSLYHGDLWHFMTPEFAVIDDMEGYRNTAGLEIWARWIDGIDDPANGSVVGNETSNGTYEPEKFQVQEGKQSLPFAYDNRVAPRSEASRIFEPPLDWVRGNPEVLSLFFLADPTTLRGRVLNDPAPLYVVIRDSAGLSARVDYPDPATTHLTTWTEWLIPLNDLAELDLSSIESMTIGIGDDGTKGKGTMYFDNIRVGTPRP